MKNLSLFLNVVLLAAVGYLYYYDFSGKKNGGQSAKPGNTASVNDSTCNRPPIAYVELDSLNENITYIKDKRKELETEQKAIETDQENGYRNLQTQKDNFLKKGAAITPDEAQQFQGMLLQQQQQIDLLQAEMRLLYQQMKMLQPSQLAAEADEPPPHY